MYNVTDGRGEAEQIISYYKRFLPKLHPHQRALLVPGTFACSTGHGVTEASAATLGLGCDCCRL